MRLSHTLLAGLLLSTCLQTGLAMAQQAERQTEPEAAPLLLDTIVLTANRGERPVSAIPGAVQMIDDLAIRDQLQRSNSATDLLARVVPGFSYSNQTLSGASETFRGRGLLILVDGVPRNTPLRDVARTLSLIDLNAVERIEVIGGASSIYGAGGTGGVVNFITRKGLDQGAGPRITVDMRARAFTKDVGGSAAPGLSVTVDQKIGAFDYAFTLSHDRTRETYDGGGRLLPSDPMLGQGGGDFTRSTNATLRLGYDIDAARRLELSFDAVRMDQKPRFFTDYTTSPVSPDRDLPYVGKSISEDSKYLTLRYTDSDFALGKLSVSVSRNDVYKRFAFNIFDPFFNTLVYYSGDPANPTADFNQSELDSTRDLLSVTVDSPLTLFGREAGLSWGIEFGNDHTSQQGINGAAIATPLKNRSQSAFAQLTLPVSDRLTLSGGLRYDRFNLNVGNFTRPAAYYSGLVLAPVAVTGGDFSFDEVTGNLGFTYDLLANTQVFGGWSQGYSLTDIGSFTRRAGLNSRAEACQAYGTSNPYVAYLYGCTTPGTFALSYADIAPRPQVVDTYEIGLRHDAGTWNGQVSAFYSTSDEGVNFDPVTNRVSQQREEIWGIEAQGLWMVGAATTLDGAIGWREGRYDTNGDGEVDAWIGNNRIGAPLRVTAGISHGFANGWSARGEVVHLGGRDKAVGQVDLHSVTLVNISAARQIGPGQFSVAVENLFDTDYMNPTATATRNAETSGWGRTVTVGYRVSF